MRKFWIVFIVIAVLFVGGLGLLWKAATSFEEPVAEGSVLRWTAIGPFGESAPDGFLEQLQAGDEATLGELVFGLKRAAEDPQIEAVVLDLRGVQVNWAQLEEIRGAVQRFRDAGKTVWAYIEAGGNADYAIATAADRIAMAPEGSLMVLGVAAELAFFRETLAKVGIEADFLHVGKYKSAPEQFTRDEASDANREMTTSLVEERYELLVEVIAAGRGRSPETVRQWIDLGLYDGETALAAGLVDTLLDVEDLVTEIYPEDDVADLTDYVRRRHRGHAEHEIALIVAEGTIYPGESRRDNFQGRVLGSDTLVDRLEQAREDDDIDAVLLRVHSPGGSALASDLIWRAVARVREDKPVVVSMGGYAASGGYYIACGADSIFADAGTLTGSIGVFAGKLDWSGLYDKLGIHREFITRGENALLWHDSGGFTPAQRELFQRQLDGFYERFLAKVAQGRRLSRDEVHAVAQGRVWTGSQAVEIGLVDGIGDLDRALSAVKAMLGVAPDAKVVVHTYAKPLSWLERTMLDALRSRAGALWRAQSEAPSAALPPPLAASARALYRAGLADALPLLDGRPLALMPWREVEPRGGSALP
ncbi:MAG TPA: signal peptide peptidase SppA [Candidatus Krumholzibacteria bacterium]|nr:signal peptide peptidase SppA [Candidatus Krumholzibacteria bacterium]HPD71402.1 signal peptide peptidase SppA [Candidatus Krumholzibacteria bacterium]HRY41665.1 signal peptide peptidase SppA [Candidatus Krumholzibacteria bacterium]